MKLLVFYANSNSHFYEIVSVCNFRRILSYLVWGIFKLLFVILGKH